VIYEFFCELASDTLDALQVARVPKEPATNAFRNNRAREARPDAREQAQLNVLRAIDVHALTVA